MLNNFMSDSFQRPVDGGFIIMTALMFVIKNTLRHSLGTKKNLSDEL
jgi:hypothetical protein